MERTAIRRTMPHGRANQPRFDAVSPTHDSWSRESARGFSEYVERVLLRLPLAVAARAWEPIQHGQHAHQILEVAGTAIAVGGVGLIIAAPIVLATNQQCDMDNCAVQALSVGLAGVVVTTVGMVTTGVGAAIPCPAVNNDWALVATPSGVALTARF
jgi:hypothetical protein